GHQTCLRASNDRGTSQDMLRRLFGTTAPDISIVQFRNEKLVIMALYRSPLTVTLWPSSLLKRGIPPAYKAHQTAPSEAQWLSGYASCASPPQVRGSNPRLDKVDSAFHSFSGSINEHQAAWELNTGGFSCQIDHLTGTSAHAPSGAQRSHVLNWSTVGLDPRGDCHANELSYRSKIGMLNLMY
ncbi:hypothetical protein TNCV_1631061, partial [Trichonephila clavipes]